MVFLYWVAFFRPFLAVVAESWIAGSWAMCYGNLLLRGLISRVAGVVAPRSARLLTLALWALRLCIICVFCIHFLFLRSAEELLLRRSSNSFAPQNLAVAEVSWAALLSMATSSSPA